jgi:CheY-like chemotaxis protein
MLQSSSASRGSHGVRRDNSVPVDTRILIVDKDRAVGKALTDMLYATGFDDVRSVLSAPRAITVADGFRPGIVFLDVELPGMDAYDLARQLLKQARQNAMRVIALTGSIDHPGREEARGAGFERYLVKPVAQVELDKVLRRPQTIS